MNSHGIPLLQSSRGFGTFSSNVNINISILYLSLRAIITSISQTATMPSKSSSPDVEYAKMVNMTILNMKEKFERDIREERRNGKMRLLDFDILGAVNYPVKAPVPILPTPTIPALPFTPTPPTIKTSRAPSLHTPSERTPPERTPFSDDQTSVPFRIIKLVDELRHENPQDDIRYVKEACWPAGEQIRIKCQDCEKIYIPKGDCKCLKNHVKSSAHRRKVDARVAAAMADDIADSPDWQWASVPENHPQDVRDIGRIGCSWNQPSG